MMWFFDRQDAVLLKPIHDKVQQARELNTINLGVS